LYLFERAPGFMRRTVVAYIYFALTFMNAARLIHQSFLPISTAPTIALRNSTLLISKGTT
jgi:hypothetical protein